MKWLNAQSKTTSKVKSNPPQTSTHDTITKLEKVNMKIKHLAAATALAIAATAATADQFSDCLINEAEAEVGVTMSRAQRFVLESQSELLGENFREIMEQQGVTAMQSIELFQRFATKEGLMDEGMAYVFIFSKACANHLE